MTFPIFRAAWLCGVSLGLMWPLQDSAHAQTAPTELPEIVVESPIARRTTRVSAVRSQSPRRTAARPAQPTEPDSTAPADLLEQSFSAVTRMTQDQIQRDGGGALGSGGQFGNLLFDRPGITGSTFAPGASRPIIRGLDNFRVRVQENGTSSMDVSELGEDHAVPIDTLSARSVEVVRGPATLRYGSQAIGGVVAIENNRIPLPSTPWGVSGQVGGAFSSVDRGWESSISLDARGKDAAIHADVFGRRSSDYDTPAGIQDNSRARARGGSIGATYLFDGGFIGAALIKTNALYHIPGLETAASNTRLDVDQTKLLSKGEYRPDASWIDAIRFWFGATNYRHDELGLDENNVDTVRATFLNKEQEGRLEVQLAPVATPFGRLTVAPGVQFNHQELSTAGEAGNLLKPTETTASAAYVFNELQVNRTLKLQGAVRVDHARVTGTPALFPGLTGLDADVIEFNAARQYTPVSGSVGALQVLPYGLVASINAQYVERAPRSPELFSRGAHDSTRTFEIGNPDLTTEVARTVELGLRRPVGSWRFDATACYTRYKNFIYKQLTGVTCDETFESCIAAPGLEFAQVIYSQRNATFKGAEISTQLDLLPFAGGLFGVEGQYDFVDARFSDGTFVPRIPPHRLGGGVYWKDSEYYARIFLLHAFDQTRLGALETPTKGYDLLKAEFSRNVKTNFAATGIRGYRYGLVATNLLDDEVRNHSSFKKDEVLLPGRSVRLFANVSF